jgi:hypothetical protein
MSGSVKPESYLFVHETSVDTSLPLTVSYPADAQLRQKWNKHRGNKGNESRTHALVDTSVIDGDPVLGRWHCVEARRILSTIQWQRSGQMEQRSLSSVLGF